MDVVKRLVTKRRPRFRSNGFPYVDEKTQADLADIKAAYSGEKFSKETPVKVVIEIFSQRPKHCKKDVDFTVRPDVDNVAKCVLDGLEGVAYFNDSQVVELHVIKHKRKKEGGNKVAFSVEKALNYETKL